MAYTKVNWTNTPSTPLNAENLNHMDDGIEAANKLAGGNGTLSNFYDAPNHAKTFTKAQNWNLYSDIKLATGEDHVTLSGVAEGSSQCGLLNLDKTLHCDADGYSTVLIKIRMRAVDCSVTVNIRDDGWFNNQCIIDSNVENWERASTYLTKELAKNEWVTAWVVVGGAERDITKVGVQAVSPATAFKIEIASIDVYYSQDSLSGDVQKANSDISQLQSNDRQLDSKITALQTDNTQNKQNITKLQTDNTQNKSKISDLITSVATNISNIAKLQNESDTLQKIQFTTISGDQSESLWTTAKEINVNLFKANSVYNIPSSAIVAGKVKGLPQEILNSLKTYTTVMTFGGTTVDSPESSDDFYSSETGQGYTVPGAGITQIAFTNGHMWQRHKISIGTVYSNWVPVGNFTSMGDAPTPVSYAYEGMNPNTIYRVTADAAGHITNGPTDISEFHISNPHTITTLSPFSYTLKGALQILSIVASDQDSARLAFRAFQSTGVDGHTPDIWHVLIDNGNLNHFIQKSEYIKSLEARIAALEKQ